MTVAVAAIQSVRTWPDKVPDERHTLGWPILEWTADYLQQPDGPQAGEAWEFTSEQVRILLRWYEIDDSGAFIHHRGVLRRMKGWGKDPFAAVLCAVELCGPCRFGGWNPDGTPKVIVHASPWIQAAAVTKDQTRNLMSLFPALFGPKARLEYELDVGKEVIYRTHGAGRIEAVTSSPRALEGSRPSLVILDETQHWLINNEGIAMEAAIRRNLGKSRDGSARAFEITNAHLMEEGSVAEQTYEAWRASDGNLRGVYYDSLEAPTLDNLEDADIVKSALRVARGDSYWVNIERVATEIADPTTTESLARRYYLNQVWATGIEQWIEDSAWQACARPGQSIPAGYDVYLGVDGSFNDDSTAIVVASTGEHPHLQVVDCWENPDDPDWRVPILDVEDSIRVACKRWRVRAVAWDPYRWARSIQVLATENVAPQLEFPNSPERMVPACQRFLEAVLNGTLTHDGDPRLARHIANVVVREGARGLRILKETKWSPRKIDLAIAAVIAHSEAAGRATPSIGWMQAWRAESLPIAEPAGAEAAVSSPPAAPTRSPKDYFGSPVLVPRLACQHRWWDTQCVKCGIAKP